MLRKQPEDRPASTAAVIQTLQAMVLDVDILDPGPVSSNLDRLARGRLVGRDQEYRQSITVWNKVAARQGQVLLVSGEPGIGKTRFVRELATHVEVSGGQLLSGECYQQGVVPYLPIAQFIRQALSDKRQLELDDALIADLLTLVPDLRSQFPRAESGQPIDSAPEQASLYESVVHLILLQWVLMPWMITPWSSIWKRQPPIFYRSWLEASPRPCLSTSSSIRAGIGPTQIKALPTVLLGLSIGSRGKQPV
jgi:hypothetical protein